ncbi:MAG: hypothetical protein GY854_14925 [Deltaproteobacteria bacterium]|nr:hypothetical protein [Deltaproteobacteria bacterium]
MTSTYNSSGVTLDRYNDIFERCVVLAKARWGESIDTSKKELIGHLARNTALLVDEINQIAQDVYDSQSVSNATGVRLASLVALIGIERLAAAYSTVTLTLTASKACTVSAGSRYSTADGVVFATDTELVFTAAGSDDVEATCTETGSNNAAIAAVTTIDTAVSGITACTNAAAATPGRLQETSAELRARHAIAVATSGNQDLGSIFEAVSEVSGVSAVYATDNSTNATVDGIPAHSIHVSTIGGTAADIATAINNTKASGVATYGSTATSVYNATTKQTQIINHSIAEEKSVHIKMTLTKIDSVYPDDGNDQMKAALVAHFADIGINDDVIFNSLYKPIYSIPGHTVDAGTLKLDIVNPPIKSADLTSTPLIRYTLDADDIDIS